MDTSHIKGKNGVTIIAHFDSITGYFVSRISPNSKVFDKTWAELGLNFHEKILSLRGKAKCNFDEGDDFDFNEGLVISTKRLYSQIKGIIKVIERDRLAFTFNISSQFNDFTFKRRT